MTSLRLICVTVAAAMLAQGATAYPTGAGDEACPINAPPSSCHGDPQKDIPPFRVHVHAQAYSPGVQIPVTLIAENDSIPFIGFLVGAHSTSGQVSEYVGNFQTDSNLTQSKCGDGSNSGATHTDKSDKYNLTIMWTPPAEDAGEIYFQAAMMQDYGTFWVGIKSVYLEASGYSPAPPHTTEPHTTVTEPTGSGIRKDSACGDSKSCYDDCKDGDCTFLVTWYKTDQSLVFSIASVVPASDYWAAVAFGPKAAMNPSSVVECVANQGKVQAFTSFNDNYSNVRNKKNNQTGLSGVSGRLEDGVMTCSVTRQLVVGGAAADPKVYNLTGSNFHVLFARGAAQGWTKVPHNSKDQYVTSAAYDLTEVTDIGAKAASLTLVKLHGCVMTLAWLLTASLGIMVARFYKSAWPGKTLCGLKVWFGLHRALMMITFIFTAGGIIFIFVHVGGYSQFTGSSYLRAHPVLGIVTTALTVLNPVMAFFRPGPDGPTRPLFNWAHWLVGCSAYIIGVVTVAVGTRLSMVNVPMYITYFVIGFGCWHTVAYLVLDLLERYETKYLNYKELSDFSQTFEAARYRFTRQVILAMHTIIAVCISVAVMDGLLD